MKRIYCTDTLEAIPQEYFAQGKAVWCNGKPYLATSAKKLGLKPDAQPPPLPEVAKAPPELPRAEVASRGNVYCADTQERIPPEYFAQGKAFWCGGKPYLAEAVRRLRLTPDGAAQPARPHPAAPPPLPKQAVPPPLPPVQASPPKPKRQAMPPPLPQPAAPPPLPKPDPAPGVAKTPVAEQLPAVKSTSAAPPRKRRWLRRLVVASAIMLLLIGGGITALLLYFNDNYFKEYLRSTTRAQIGRELTIDSLRVSFWNGTVDIRGVSLKNADGAGNTARLESVSLQVARWPLINGGFKTVENLQIDIKGPEFFLERRRMGDKFLTNFDDVLQKLKAMPPTKWPVHTGLRELTGDIRIDRLAVRVIDETFFSGDTSIDVPRLTVALGGLGKAAQINGSIELKTPAVKEPGNAVFSTDLIWIDAGGRIEPTALSNISSTFAVHNFDLAQLLRHFDIHAALPEPHGTITLGNPLTGTVKLDAKTLSQAKVIAKLSSTGGVALNKGGEHVIDPLPCVLDLAWDAGLRAGQIEQDGLRGKLSLANPGSAGPIILNIDFNTPEKASSTDAVNLKIDARLDELLATKTAEAFGVKGRFGGVLQGNAQLKPKDSRLQVVSTLQLKNGFVHTPAVRQPLNVDVAFKSEYQPGTEKSASAVTMEFNAKTASCELSARTPFRFELQKDVYSIAVDTTLNCIVQGREFWQEFAPLMAFANMTVPLEERLEGQLHVSGALKKWHAELSGNLVRANEQPAPIAIQIKSAYDASAFGSVENPLVALDVRATSEPDKATDIHMAVNYLRGPDEIIADVHEFQNTGTLNALNNLNARFGAYAYVFLGPKYDITGTITQTGRSRFVRKLGENGDTVATTLDLSTDLKLSKANIKGPALVPNGPPLQWNEDELNLQLAMSLKDGPDGAFLKIDNAKMDTASASVDGTLESSSVAKLKTAAAPNATPVATWLQALAKSKLTARASVSTIARLQALNVLPNDPLLAGDLQMSADYDPAQRRIHIPQLSFKGAAADCQVSIAEVDANAVGALVDKREKSFAKWAEALPSLKLDATAHPPLLAWLQTIGNCPVKRSSQGDMKLKAAYDPAKQRALVQQLDLNTPGLVIKTAVSEIDLLKLAQLADTAGITTAKWIEALPAFELDAQASPAAVTHLQDKGYWPKESFDIGDMKLKGRYDTKARRGRVESFEFTGEELRLKASASDVDVAALAVLFQDGELNVSRWLSVLPDLTFDAFIRASAVARLQQLKILPSDVALKGDLGARGSFQQSTKKTSLSELTFSSNSAKVTLAAPDIDMTRVAQLLSQAGNNVGAALQSAGDFALEVKGQAGIFDALRERKWIPADLPMSGDVQLIARYQRDKDRMNIESATFVRSQGSECPIKSLSLSAQIASASQRLNNLPSMTALISAPDQEFNIRQIDIDTPRAVSYLQRSGIKSVFLDNVIAGVYRVDDPLVIKDLQLKPLGNETIAVSSRIETGIALHPIPAPQQLPQSAPAASLSGAIVIPAEAPLRIDLNKRQAQGTILLNETAIKYADPNLPYDKPAGTACKVDLSAELTAQNILNVNSFDVTGGPVNLALRKLQWFMDSPQFKLSLDSVAIKDSFLASEIAVDMAADKIKFKGAHPGLNLNGIAALVKLPTNVAVSGVVTNIQAAYDGSISAIKNGALTFNDKYSLRAQLNNLQLSGAAARGKTLLTMQGEIAAENTRVSSPGILCRMDHTPANGTARVDAFAVALDISPKQQNTNLLDAIKVAGLPLLAKVGLRVDNAFDVDPFIDALRVFAEGDGQATGDAMNYARVKQTRVEAGLWAPQVKYDDIVLNNVAAALLVLDDMKVGIRNSKASIFGGDVEIVEAVYDLNAQPIAHWSTVNFSNINLPTLLGVDQMQPVKDVYQVFARLSGSAALQGQGFRKRDRGTWNGSASVQVNDLVLLKNGGKNPGTDVGKALIGGFGAALGGGLGRAAKLYGADFGLFLNQLEFEPTVVQAQLSQGTANVYQTLLTGKNRSAGLQFGAGGSLNIGSQKFEPKFYVWPTYLPDTTQRLMGLYEIDPTDRNTILEYMKRGSYYITLTGKFEDPKRDDKPIMDLLGWIDARIQARRNPQPQPQVTNYQQQQIDWNNLFNAINQATQQPARAQPAMPQAGTRTQQPKKR